MNKQELLQELVAKLETGDIVVSDLEQIIVNNSTELLPAEQSQQTLAIKVDTSSSLLSKILYYLGGGIVFLGMIFFIAQQWHGFSSNMKIFVTLGSGLALFIVGVLFSTQTRLGAAGPAFFLIAALLLPVGLLLSYELTGVKIDPTLAFIQISGILLLTYLITYLILYKNVLLIFSLLFGTWLFFACLVYFMKGSPLFDLRFLASIIFLLGLTYLLLAYSFTDSPRQSLSGWLYSLGAATFLGAGLALSGWQPAQSHLWEAIYPGLVFAIIFLSITLKTKSLLIFGSLGLGIYLIKMTSEYFSHTLGWPLSLVLIGFMLMGVAYLALRLNRNYIRATY